MRHYPGVDAFKVLVDALRTLDPDTYQWRGEPVPFIDGPTTVEIQTAYPSSTFGWSLNGQFRGTIQSNASGVVVLSAVLPHGTQEFRVEHDFSGDSYAKTLQVLYLATVYQAWADVFEAIDEEINAYRTSKVVDAARVDYLESVHGVRLGLANDLGLSETAYRNAVKVLAANYRTQHGVQEAIEQVFAVLTGADGFVVPSEWRRFWSVGDNLAENADQAARTLTVESTPDDPNLYIRRQFVVEAWAAAAANTYAGTLAQPPVPSVVNVYFPTGWNAANTVTVVGLDVEGVQRTETYAVPGSLPGLVPGTRVLATISSVSKANALGSGNVSLGLASGDFVRLEPFANTPLGTGTLAWSVPATGTAGATATWRTGPSVGLDATIARSRTSGRPEYVDVPGVSSVSPHVVGHRVIASGGTVAITDTGASANVRGRVTLNGVETEVRTNTNGTRTAAQLLSDFSTANPGAVGSLLSDFDPGTGAVLGLLGSLSTEVGLRATACDYFFGGASVLQLPVLSATTTATLASGATSVTATGLAGFSPTTGNVPWDGTSVDLPTSPTAARGVLVRVGRGRRINQSLTVSVVPIAGSADATVTFTPTSTGAVIPGDFAPGAYLRLTGASGWPAENNGLHAVVSLSGTAGGLYTARLRHVDAATGGAFASATSVGSITVELYSMGETARLTAVNIGTSTATLAVGDGGLRGVYPSGITIEREADLSFARRRIQGTNYDALRVWVDARYRPQNASTASVSASVTVVGRPFADGWRPFDNSDVGAGAAIGVVGTRHVGWRAGGPLGGASRTLITPPIAANVLPGVGGFVPESRLAPWRDQVLRIDAQVSSHNGVTGNDFAAIEVSFDGGDTWTLGTNTTGTSVPNRFYNPLTGFGAMATTGVTTSVEVPALAGSASRTTLEGRGLWWRVRFSDTAWPSTTNPPAGSYFSVAGVAITPVFGAAGGGHIARELVPVAAARRVYGALVYAWPGEDIRANNTSPGATSLVEVTRETLRRQALGQVQSLSHAAGVREVFYVGEYALDSGSGNQVITNRLGAHDTATFGAATLENMTITPETPFGWLSWARPTSVPTITVSAVFSGSPLRATLTNAADKTGSFPQAPNSDDVLAIYPVNQSPTTAETIPVNLWSWVSATQIEIDATIYNALAARYGAGASWAVTYRRPVRLTTDVLYLGAAFSEYTWLVDASVWARSNPTPRVLRTTEALAFSPERLAVLQRQPNPATESTAVIRVTSPSRVTTLSRGAFEFRRGVSVGGRPETVVALPGAPFDPANYYELEYDNLALSARAAADYTIEVRTAAAEADIPGATWYPARRHEALDIGRTVGVATATRPYAQVRLTFTRVDLESLADVRVFSVGVKGVRLRGASRFAPGVLP